MKMSSYSEMYNNLTKAMDESWQETVYLAHSLAMRRRLRSAVNQLESGKGKTRRLIII